MSASLPTRYLGKNKLPVSQIGLGCMGLSFALGDPKDRDDARSIQLIRGAYALGIRFFDTAECYGPHTNEVLVGEAISSLPRQELTIATKCGIYFRDGGNVLDGSRANIRRAIADSLARLRTDYVDLYYLHRVDPKVPIEEVAQTMKELHEEGKIRHWGLSEASPATIRRAHAVFPLTAVQSEYSLFFREPETELLPTLKELGIGFVPFSPLGRGFLTGAITPETAFCATDTRAGLPRFSKENLTQNMALVDVVKQMASKKHATPAQIALAWLCAQGEFIAPIPGTTKMARLEENVGSAKVHLTAEELAELSEKTSQVAIAGARYGAAAEAMVDRSK